MFKNLEVRLFLISVVTTLAVLAALPQIKINVNTSFLKLTSVIGGYDIKLLGGKARLDLRDLKKGLDLKGGIKVVLEAKMDDIAAGDRDSALESAKEVISRRVNMLGVTEPYVTTSKIAGTYRVIVEIPGLDNVTDAVRLIGQTAQLKYKVLKPDTEWNSEDFVKFYTDPTVWQDTNLSGADMIGAEVVMNQQADIRRGNSPQIQLKFSEEGRKKFEVIAKENINKPVALFLDEDESPLSMPVVDPELAKGLSGDPVISGNFTMETAKNLSIQIRAGALPVPVEVMEQKTIGATLGSDSVTKSFFAAGVGLLLVFIFLVFRYGKFGILAGVSLLIYSALVLAIFKTIPVVLTLPGIAGFILSIGMATDANILVFERIKEETLWGKPIDLAIHLGFDRAWNSIKDSNMSSLITSAILFQFGSGPVRGFALTLAIGIAVSLFTSLFVVRNFIELFNIGKVDNRK